MESGWSAEHTSMALAGVAILSEVIGASKYKSNSVIQLFLNLGRSLIGLRGKRG